MLALIHSAHMSSVATTWGTAEVKLERSSTNRYTDYFNKWLPSGRRTIFIPYSPVASSASSLSLTDVPNTLPRSWKIWRERERRNEAERQAEIGPCMWLTLRFYREQGN